MTITAPVMCMPSVAEFTAQASAMSARNLCLDSRRIVRGDLFFSLSSGDTKSHIAEAEKNGAVAIVIDAAKRHLIETALPVIPVDNLAACMGEIAHGFYGEPSARCAVIGITGTNGKTSCSHWMAQAWLAVSGSAGMMGTLGCGLAGVEEKIETGMTTADVLSNHRLLARLVEKGAQAVAMEVSSHALDQGRVDGVMFDTAVFTNLSRDHLDYHGNMENYALSKRKLFERSELKYAVINRDDAYGKLLCDEFDGVSSSKQLLTYAIADQTADLGVERFEVTGRGINASIRTPWGRGALQSRFPGGFNLLNLLAVVGTLCAHGMRLQTVLDAIEQLQAVPGRTQIVSQAEDSILVVVDYAHTPDALQKMLAALREQCRAQLWCVFGCGGNRDSGKRPMMAEVAANLADQIVVTSDNPRDEDPLKIIADIVQGFSGAAHTVISDRAAAIASVIAQASAGDVVLLAGKGHENYQEIAGKHLPFSDVDVAQSALKMRRQVRA